MIHLLSALVAAAITLPGGPPVGIDYLAYDSASGRIWVPAGNTGIVDVVDVATGKVTPLAGFATKAAARAGRPAQGPSSVTLGEQVVWIGNRGDDRICSFDRRSLAAGACVQLGAMPDGLAYVLATRELWVTTPHARAITIVGVAGKQPGAPALLELDGSPEGYAVDGVRPFFYTNLEDRDRTLAIDVRTRKVVARFSPGCGGEGPRGLAMDSARRLLFVACTDGAVALDLARDGRVVGRIKTGGGVDNLDYHAPRGLLYVASASAGTLTIARVGPSGALTVAAQRPTAKGARNPIVDAQGTAYVADSAGGRLIVIAPPAGSAPPAASIR
jgi:DNA-binding beta-propeller fold protein YncE